MGSNFRRLWRLWFRAIVVLLPVTVATVKFVPTTSVWFTKIVGVAGAAWLITIVYTFTVVLSFRLRGSVVDGDLFIRGILANKTEYCLMLRPFGADGYTPLDKPTSEKQDVMMFVNTSRTLEQVVESEVKELLGCSAVALVDSRLTTLPTSPTYIGCTDLNWKRIVEVLIRRALLVVIVLPPNARESLSLHWEISQVVRWGLLDRLLFILPPPKDVGYEKALHTLNALLGRFLPDLNRIEPPSIVVAPLGFYRLQMYMAYSRFRIGGNLYSRALREALSVIAARVSDQSFEDRYPYSRAISPNPNASPDGKRTDVRRPPVSF